MIPRKKKLRIIQISLLLIGLFIVIFTYSDLKIPQNEKIIPQAIKDEIKKKETDQVQSGDVFYNIEYSGFDLSGNRYILKAEEAINEKLSQNLVKMKYMVATFYFKDQTVLVVKSDNGKYNNKTLDMSFHDNVRASYGESKLFAKNAIYSNSKRILKISDDILVKDIQGTIKADELTFDINKQTLDISSFNNSKINANVNIK